MAIICTSLAAAALALLLAAQLAFSNPATFWKTSELNPYRHAPLLQADSPREHVTFDYGWRFRFGHAPDGAPGPGDTTFSDIAGFVCSNMEHNPNRFTAYDCMVACAYNPQCMAWQQDKSYCTHGQADAKCSKSSSHGVANGGQRSSAPPLRTAYKFAEQNFSDADWRVVDVPHDFVVEGDFVQMPDVHHGYLLRNVSWYRKPFHLPTDWKGSHIELYFEGVFHVAQIWVNGQYVQMHTCGYTGFTVRLDNVTGLEYGTETANVVAVRTDATFGSGHWYEGGGIYRRTHLIRSNLTHFVHNGVFASPEVDLDVNEMNVSMEMETFTTSSLGLSAQLVLLTVDGQHLSNSKVVQYSIKPGTPQIMSVPLPFGSNVTRWSIQNPVTYIVQAWLFLNDACIDRINVTTGIRQTNWSGASGFALNNKALKFRGFSHHNSFTGVGVAIPDRVHLFRAQASKAVGGSFWRMSHNPYLPALYDYLDAVGIITWDENRDYGLEYTPAMHEMVKRDRHHPSVVVWSYCNEYECGQVTDQTGLAFRAAAKALDPQRPTAANGGTDGLDVQGMSHAGNSSFISFHKKNPDVPLVLSECCSCQTQRLNRGETTTCMRDQNSPGLLPFVAGSLGVWTLFDYYGESHGWPSVTSSYGNFDLAGFPKPHAYWYVVNWLAMRDMQDPGRPLVPAVHATRILDLPSDIGNTVAVLSSGVEVEVFVDGKSVGSQAAKQSGEPLIFNVTSSTPASCSYDRNLSAVQCHGLDRSSKAKSPSACEAACCAKKEKCRIWQYSASTGCWIGNVALSTCTPSADWVGAGNAASISTVLAVSSVFGHVVSNHTLTVPKDAHSVLLQLDVPSPTTGTGSKLVLDGHDAALVRASVVDKNGVVVTDSQANITFQVVSGPARLIGVGNGDNTCHQNAKSSHVPAYGGLARGIFQVTVDCVSKSRDRIIAIDVDQGPAKVQADACPSDSIVVSGSSDGLTAGTLTIAVSSSAEDLPLEVARQSASLEGYTYLADFVG